MVPLRTLPQWVRERIAKDRRDRQAVLDTIRAGVLASDPDRIGAGLAQCEYILDGFSGAARVIRRCPPPSASCRRWFRDDLWVRFGDHLRSEVGSAGLLADALRVMMPPYHGRAALRLWRGEIAANLRRRTYGLSWSRSIGVADGFARGIMRTCRGGSVILETDAPAPAIICRVPDTGRYGELETLVDPRLLKRVRVTKRYAQVARDEYRRANLQHGCNTVAGKRQGV
jgi:hypothetical protein